jgi:hypothetical protein
VDEALAVVDRWLAAHPDLQAERFGDHGRYAVLRGDRKRTIPVHLELGEHTLTATSFFVRGPDERADEVYGLLLRQHLRTYVWRFTLDPDGDILLLAVLPLAALTEDELDRVLGQLLTVADDTFDRVLRLGFSSYISREQAWRARVGAPRHPIS